MIANRYESQHTKTYLREMFDDKIVNYGRLYVAGVVATELYALYKGRRYFDVWNKFRYEVLHVVSDAIGY